MTREGDHIVDLTELVLIAEYVDETGAIIATDRYRPNTERYSPAQKLPALPQGFVCLRCQAAFLAHPGEAECPRCGHLYCDA